MPRYFFHLEDHQTIIDHEGTELPDLGAARDEAVVMSAEILRGGRVPLLWNGMPWRLWVTDQPGWTGKTLFAIQFSATDANASDPKA
jgi:hypothetical protein